MFEQLDDYQKSYPKKYMDIFKTIRDGNFDVILTLYLLVNGKIILPTYLSRKLKRLPVI